MAEPFLAEIRMFSFNYAPQGWATCDGQSLPVRQNQALYSLILNTYGGDQTNFNLPDLRGRVPIQPNNTNVLYGRPGGKVQQALALTEIPAHTHQAMADSANGTSVSPIVSTDGGAWAAAAQNQYAPLVEGTKVILNSSTITTSGGGQAHSNMQPYQTINFCIALMGVYPMRP